MTYLLLLYLKDIILIAEYIGDILTVMTISAVMVVSPGQDFAMVTRSALIFSRKAAMLSALGVFAGIWVHVAYSLAGIAIVISKTPMLYNFIKYAGASYLLYLGIKGLLAKKEVTTDTLKSNGGISNLAAFRNGFLSNALNPKTTLFFLSIFTQVIDGDTPLTIQFLYGAIIAIAHLIWFTAVAYFFSSKSFIKKFNAKKVVMERIIGGALVLFSVKIFTR